VRAHAKPSFSGQDVKIAVSPGYSICWLPLGDDGMSAYEAEFLPRMPGGAAKRSTMVCGRGDRLFLLAGDQLHEVAVADLVGRLH
jgi:hypothetical protein